MSTITLKVPGMTCGHCEAAVKGEIGKLAGVSSVSVDLATKDVVIDGTDLDLTAIHDAIEEAGFEPAS
jgi:copper chaperone